VPEESTALVPTSSKVQKRKPRSAKGIAQFQSKVHAEYFPDIYKAFYLKLKDAVEKGEEWAIKLVAEMAKLTGKASLVTVNNNLQQNNTTVNRGRDRRFEAIIRKLEDRDNEQRLHPISDVQDAEFEDVTSADSDA
jgi:hypothetical protein